MTNQKILPGASSVPFTFTGAPGATVTYTFTEGTNTLTGTGVIGASGTFGAVVNLSAFPDGAITVTIVQTGGGKPTKTVTGTLNKNSVPPAAPTAAAACNRLGAGVAISPSKPASPAAACLERASLRKWCGY